MQGPISVFNRLIHASGLDDQEWEFRIVNAPCKQTTTSSLSIHRIIPNSKGKTFGRRRFGRLLFLMSLQSAQRSGQRS